MNSTKYMIRPAAKAPVEVTVPGSKSITNRALLIAALAEGRSELSSVLFSDDSRHFLQAMIDLGFAVEMDEAREFVAITGLGGAVPASICAAGASPEVREGFGHTGASPEVREGSGRAGASPEVRENPELVCASPEVREGSGHTGASPEVREGFGCGADAAVDVGSAGTAARFLAAYLGLSGGRYYMTASAQMRKRPMKELLEALVLLGADIAYEDEEYHFPFLIENTGRRCTEITVDIDRSSQFLSALLISSVLFDEDFVIHAAGSHGMAYVEMTLQMMEQFGVGVERPDERTFLIKGNARYQARRYTVEPDVSAAAYFYAMCPVLGVSAKVLNVHWDCLQGDIAFLHVLEQMGCRAAEEADGIRMEPPEGQLMHGGEFDLSAFSDQALTLAAISCFADSPVVIQKIGHIRYQECDRIQAILQNLERMGIACSEEGGDITIWPGQPHGCEIETFEDHRVAMSFAIPGLVTDGITIVNPMCCRKTFEHYFDMLEQEICT